MSNVKKNTLKLVQLGLLSGLIILLQLYLNIPLPGGLTLCMVMVPIVVGAGMFGPSGGALLGGVFGAVVSALVIGNQAGPLSAAMWAFNPVMTIVVCMVKGIAAGLVAGLIVKAFRKKPFVGILLASAAAPIVNTGIFLLGILTIFKDTVMDWAAKAPEAGGAGYAGSDIFYVAIVIIIGMNFVVELAANLILAPAIHSILNAVKKIGR